MLGVLAACGGDGGTGPSNNPPARLDAVTDLSRTAAVGTAVPGGVVVKVSDASGRAVQNAAVQMDCPAASTVTRTLSLFVPAVATT